MYLNKLELVEAFVNMLELDYLKIVTPYPPYLLT